jgi:DNA modification methylase
MKTRRSIKYSINVVDREISELTLNPQNPRFHSSKQIGQLARSIDTFGFLVPVLVDSQGRIIAGHGRVLACKLLGITRIPTICISHLSQHQLAAFLIADNRLTENSKWDDRLLAEQILYLSKVELDFDLDVIGFEVAEIDLKIAELSTLPDGERNGDDIIPEVPDKVRICRPGDMWKLGDHSILCASALEAQSYALLLNGKRAGLVFTDPPFNVKISGHVGGLGKIRHREFKMASGEMSEQQFTDFLAKVMAHSRSYSVDGSIHFICMDWRHLKELLTAGNRASCELKNLVVWVKSNAGMGSLYRSQHELIAVFKSGREPHRNNIQLGQYGRYRTNVWNYPGANSFSRKTSEGNLLELHPTVKPLALVADAILDCSKRNDIVMDPFCGSGTTILAAERTGRVCYALEIDPIYVDTSIRRWQNATGGKAVNSVTGESFSDFEGR